MAKSEPDIAALFSAMPLEEQITVLNDLTALHNTAKAAKRAELMAELEKLGGTYELMGPRERDAVKATKAKAQTLGIDARAAVKPMYRGPNGEEWSGRGAMPKWAKALGITDKAGLEPYRIRD